LKAIQQPVNKTTWLFLVLLKKMEAFLSTLPPYVHEFIDKYPPTDVFNLLKELICFAVLYSDDRERINQSTEELLKKRKQQLEDQQVQV
jgi:hypothetical protein